jgi:hypothetical protein
MKEFYLARSSQGGLVLFNQKPTKKTYVYNEDLPEYRIELKGWTTPEYEKYGRGFLVVNRELYPEITYENSPKKVTFKIE